MNNATIERTTPPATLPDATPAAQPPQTTTTTAPSRVEPAAPKASSRRYFEVFGDALMETLFLRNTVILLGGACLVLTITLCRLAVRPPMVIRVDNMGDPIALQPGAVQNAVTGPEVRNFAEHFTQYLLAWDKYALGPDVDKALGMMTMSAARRMMETLHDMEATPFTQEHAIRTTITFAEISVEKDTPEFVLVKVRATRSYLSYTDSNFKKEITFEDTFVARKAARTVKTPWGLLVDDWRESIFKQTP